MELFKVTDYDKKVYEEQIRDFLPDNIIDIHTHVWRDEDGTPEEMKQKDHETVTWPSLVAAVNPIEDHIESYRLMFPGKKVTALMFASRVTKDNFRRRNAYLSQASKDSGYPALYYSHPDQTSEDIEKAVVEGGFLGVKSYLSLAPAYIPDEEIRILDFFTHDILKVMDKLGLIVMLHIPRSKRFKDPVNLAQILEIKEKYPNLKLIVAHIGRAYCNSDVGDAFKVLSASKDLLFDFSANTNADVFTQALEWVGPDRLLFGSDMPILRMRMRRIDENGKYINLIPPGLYGDPSQDSHLREVSKEEGEKLTFFMYEEILAMKEAVRRMGMGAPEVNKMFYENSRNLLRGCGYEI